MEYITQPEIAEISGFLSECPVLPVQFVHDFLVKRGKSPEQIEKITNQMLKRKLMYLDDSAAYYQASKMYRLCDTYRGQIKALWLYLYLYDSISRHWLQHDTPRVFSFFKEDNNTEDPIFDVFYVKYGDEYLSSGTINNGFAQDSQCKIFVILDNKSQISKLNISKTKFAIYAYVLVSSDGEIELIETEE